MPKAADLHRYPPPGGMTSGYFQYFSKQVPIKRYAFKYTSIYFIQGIRVAPHLKEILLLQKRILLVEDNFENRKILSLLIKMTGFHCVTAENGEEAVAAIKKEPVSLIFMDCQMPVMDGFSATIEIRKLEKGTRYTPIIAMTGNGLEEEREHCFEVGMDDFLEKPIEKQTLQEFIHKWLNDSEE